LHQRAFDRGVFASGCCFVSSSFLTTPPTHTGMAGTSGRPVAALPPDLLALVVESASAWVARVLFGDAEILRAGMAPVLAAWARRVWREGDPVAVLRDVRAPCMSATVETRLRRVEGVVEPVCKASYAVAHLAEARSPPLLVEWLMDSVRVGRAHFSPAHLVRHVPEREARRYVNCTAHLYTQLTRHSGGVRLRVPLVLWVQHGGQLTDWQLELLVDRLLAERDGCCAVQLEFTFHQRDRAAVGASEPLVERASQALRARCGVGFHVCTRAV